MILINVLLEEVVYTNPLGTNQTDLDRIFEIWKNFCATRIDKINLKWEKTGKETFATERFSELWSFYLFLLFRSFLTLTDYNFDCSKKNLKQNMYDVLKENSINDKVLLFTLI